MNLGVSKYILFVVAIFFLGIIINWKIPKEKKDNLSRKTKVTGFRIATGYIALITNPIVIKSFAGEVLSQLASSILDFISLVSITVGILEIILSMRFKEFIDKTNSSFQPIFDAIHDFKKEHIKIYNLTQLDAFTKQDPIFNHKIVKQEGYLHIASLMRDFDIVLSGKLILRSYDQFLNILDLLTDMLDATYHITIIDHINVSEIPATMSGGYSFIEKYSSVINKLINKVKSCKRIVIVDREEDIENEKLLLLLFSQLDAIPTLYFTDKLINPKNRVVDNKHFNNRTRILITKNECECNSSNSCVYCYSIKFVSPYNGKLSEDLFKSELDVLKSNPTYSGKFQNYVKIFHSQKKEYITNFENDKKLFLIDYSKTVNLTKDTIFAKLPPDKEKYYSLYKDVNTEWTENLKLDKPTNIYGCDTTILDNEIEGWLNRPFYQYILKQNGKVAEELNKKQKTLKRFFILDKVRESKIQTLTEIISEHIKNGIAVSIVPISSLINKKIKCIYDFNFIEDVCIFEIDGLRRKYDENDEKFKLIVSDRVPTYHHWEKYEKGTDMYQKIMEFKNILDSVKVDITKDNLRKILSEYRLKEVTLKEQKEKLNKYGVQK